jgi:hypothetical protein
MSNNEKQLRAIVRNLVKETISEMDMETPEAPLKLKGGLTKQQLGGTTALNRADDFIESLKSLDDVKQSKALAYVMSRIGMDPKSLQSNLSRIKTSLKQYSK